MSIKKLLVIIPDDVNVLLAKGEYPERYYNPGDLFDEVHILITNDVVPDVEKLQFTVGTAKLTVHNLPIPNVQRPFGRLTLIPHLGFQRVWARNRLKSWVQAGIQLTKDIAPSVIRCHGGYLNAYLAGQIYTALDVPYIVSLHTHPIVDLRGRYPWRTHFAQRMAVEQALLFEKESLENAPQIVLVYEALHDYLDQIGVRGNRRVCYNMLNTEHLHKKDDYTLHTPPRIICVGRQYSEKNPENVIRAVARLEAELTVVGDGDYHDYLKQVADECNLTDRVTFHRAIPNDDLCKMLPDYDIFATQYQSFGIAKAVLEPLITGLPVVMNRRDGLPVTEFEGDWITLVDDTVDGYYTALRNLIDNHDYREKLGRRAYDHSQSQYAPEITERTYVEVYQSVVPKLAGG